MIDTQLGPARVICSDRDGGVSRPPFDTANVGDHIGDDDGAVAENRRRLATAAGLPDPAGWIWLRQVHGREVHVATGPFGAPVAVPEADAVVTDVPGLPLAVVTADCAPVALACDDAVGVVHVGHRGLTNEVVEHAVARLREIGRGPVRARLGPCIHPAHYAFGDDDLAHVVALLGPEVQGRTHDGRPALDIPAAVGVVCARAGVQVLADTDVCTYESPHHFSYRRDGTTGRQVTVVVLA